MKCNVVSKATLQSTLFTGICFLSGCAVVQRAGIGLFYQEAPLGSSRVIRNLPYTIGSDPKQQLDLFCPAGTNWPVLVYIYGGGWTSGDKALRVGGKDVYGNIGRFYAARGIGVAVINYRLQPDVNWREQVTDVAAAVAFVKTHFPVYGADANRIFLAGHSAGAHLALSVALNPLPLAAHSLSPKVIKGVISVSGAGLDIAAPETYLLGAKRSYYEERFCDGECQPGWDTAASPVHYLSSNAPPVLILYAGGETKALKWQSQHLFQKFSDSQVSARLLEVPGQSHQRMVLVLSRSDKIAAPAIVDFVKSVTPPIE